MKRRNTRGFRIYSKFRDSYRSEVRVQESSSAQAPHVWIFCHDGNNPNEDFTPHLNRAQAKRVRDALDRFLTETAPRRSPRSTRRTR